MEVLCVKNEGKKYEEYVVTLSVGNEETGKMEPVLKLVRSEPIKVEVQADFSPLAKKIHDVLSSGTFDQWYRGQYSDYLADYIGDPESDAAILKKIKSLFGL